MLTASLHLMLITVLESVNLSALHRWGRLRGSVRGRLSKFYLTPKSLSTELEISNFFCCCLCYSPRCVKIPEQWQWGPGSPPARLFFPVPQLPPDPLLLHRPHLGNHWKSPPVRQLKIPSHLLWLTVAHASSCWKTCRPAALWGRGPAT